VIDRAAVLSVTDLDRLEEVPYWCEAISDGEKVVGFRLRKFGGEETHDISRDLLTCNCGDATFRPERPGGCRHQQAPRQALPTVTGAKPAPRVIDRKTERDGLSAPDAA
jgi:hypothetical protein